MSRNRSRIVQEWHNFYFIFNHTTFQNRKLEWTKFGWLSRIHVALYRNRPYSSSYSLLVNIVRLLSKKDGHQRRLHRFCVSCPSPNRPLDPMLYPPWIPSLFFWGQFWCRIIGFPRMGHQPQRNSTNLLCGKMFAENCMKMKKLDLGDL